MSRRSAFDDRSVPGSMRTATSLRTATMGRQEEEHRRIEEVLVPGAAAKTTCIGFGPGMTAMTPQDRLQVDAAWGALR